MQHMTSPLRTAKRLTTTITLLALLGAAGCMTAHQRAVSLAPPDVTSLNGATIDAAQDKCAGFGCEQ